MKFHFVLLLILVFGLGVSTVVAQEDQNAPGNPEVWGGEHVSLVMSKANTTLEFDCAEGVIMNPIRPDANGDFTAAGTFTPQRGGPVKKDSPPADLPATYKGTIHGNTMRLQVMLTGGNAQPPEFTLTRGAVGHLVKCR